MESNGHNPSRTDPNIAPGLANNVNPMLYPAAMMYSSGLGLPPATGLPPFYYPMQQQGMAFGQIQPFMGTAPLDYAVPSKRDKKDDHRKKIHAEANKVRR
jgi:hypothetical protein